MTGKNVQKCSKLFKLITYLLGNRVSHNWTPFFKFAVTIKAGSTGLNFADEKFAMFGQYENVVLTGQGTASTVCSKIKEKTIKHYKYLHPVALGVRSWNIGQQSDY